MPVPHADRHIKLFALVAGLAGVAFDVVDQSLKHIEIKIIRLLVMNRNCKSIDVESKNPVHRSKRQLQRIGNGFQGSRT